jgi:hypothetical protein
MMLNTYISSFQIPLHTYRDYGRCVMINAEGIRIVSEYFIFLRSNAYLQTG